ncbi:unknown [Prevotella sp. CAG:592]|nr:unknown [Prevotella sp. CAG:592]
MNVGPESTCWLSTRMPPNHNTMIIITVPRNSLMGCAICWRVFTLRIWFL